MDTAKWAGLAAALVAAGIWSAKAESPAATPSPVSTNAVTAAKAEKPQTICPVMKVPIDKKLFVDHDGKRIYLCCRGCIGAVKKDPAKYVAAMESEGIVLEKVPAAAK
jgi:YHS domain-containing protein